MILPALVLGTIPLAIIARITRSSLLDVLGLDYIRTAQAKGLSDRAVVRRPRPARTRCCRSSRSSASSSAACSAGAVLTETIFNLAGVGRAVTEAIADARLRRRPGVRPGDRGRLPGRST